MNKVFHSKSHWANQLILLGGLLFGGPLSAQMSRTVILSAEVHKSLADAQEALKNNQLDLALTLTREALASSQITAVERTAVLRTQAVVAMRNKNWDLAIGALEFLVTSPDVAVPERLTLFESLMNVGQQKKDNALVVRWARQYLKEGGPKQAIRVVLIQTLAVMGEHKQVVEEMLEKIRLDRIANVNTPEQQLRLLAVSYRQLKDNAGYQATLRRLLEAYPSKAYWAEVIQRMAQKSNLNSRVELDLYRLLEETQNLEEADEYSEMANLALRAGLPSEAVRVLTKGFDAGVLGRGVDALMHAKLRADAYKKAQEDDRTFAQFEKTAKDSSSWKGVGDVYASKQNWTAANAAYAKALELGNLRRESELRLHYAISLIKAGKKEAAREQLAAVQGDAITLDLAGLWALLAQ